jgi:hypothetical protein
MSPLPHSKGPPPKGPQICRQRHEGDPPRVDPPSAPTGTPPTPRQPTAGRTRRPIRPPRDAGRPSEGELPPSTGSLRRRAPRRPPSTRPRRLPSTRWRSSRTATQCEGRERGMDEPRHRLHGTTLGLCRRRSPTEARRERGEGTAARVRAPPVSSLESDAGPFPVSMKRKSILLECTQIYYGRVFI